MGLVDRLTLCVSSQWGCAMKCSFCLTGDLGLSHLQVSGVNQILQVSRDLPKGRSRITNVVMMGMGEPLHNYKISSLLCVSCLMTRLSIFRIEKSLYQQLVWYQQFEN